VRLAPGTQLEALVVSDYRSQNMELNPNVSWDKVDLGENLRTAYVESPDGRYGFRLRFAGIYENRLERGDRVRLDLGGCSLTGETDPERYTVDGLCTANVEVLERGVALPAKERRIADLKDEDLYTYVTLAGTEFLSKQGCYANVFESCVQRSRLNAFDQPSRRTDGWASLLKDADNGSIYMLVNTKCAWRRDGRGVPHGVGAVSGVLVHTPMRRYGGDMGRYAIRPLDERDIAIPRDTASSYVVVAEWNWDRNYDGAIRFEKQGYTPRSPKSGVAGDRVLPDAGEGFLSTTSGARMRLDTEYDTRYAQDGDGKAMRVNAALRLDRRAGRLARQVLPDDRYALMERFVTDYVRDNPASEGDETDNTTLAWLEYLRAAGVEHDYATGSIAEVLADVNDRLSGQTQQVTNSVSWSKDIFEMRLRQDSLRLQVGAQLDSLERSFNRIVVVAEHLPEISDKVLEELNRQATQLIWTMNASVDNAFADFDRQRGELQQYVTREREALVEQLRATGDELVRTTLDAVPRPVGKILL